MRIRDALRIERVAGMQDGVAERERSARSPRPTMEHDGEIATADMSMRAEGDADRAGEQTEHGVRQGP
jgi:hypothetical protein